MCQSAVSREYWFSKKIAHRTGSNRNWVYLNPGNASCVSTRLSQFGKRFSVGALSPFWASRRSSERWRTSRVWCSSYRTSPSEKHQYSTSHSRKGKGREYTMRDHRRSRDAWCQCKTWLSPFWRETQLKAKGNFCPFRNFEQKLIYIYHTGTEMSTHFLH